MNKKILIVDDEPNIIVPLEFLMEQNNYEVRTAGTGELALEQIAAWKPDLILLDIMLPGLDGFEVCRQIREQTEFRDIKVIFLSAMAGSIDIEKGLGLSADDYITKPFATDHVVTRVRELLSD